MPFYPSIISIVFQANYHFWPMTLIPYRPKLQFGSRHVSMFDTLGDTLAQNLSEDPEVQTWVTAIKSDPAVRLVSLTARETGFYLTTALKMSNSLFRTATLPVTIPLSKYYPKKDFELTPCPFPAARITKMKGNGELVVRQNNPIENIVEGAKNLSYKAELSKSFLVRSLYKLGSLIFSLPARFQLTEPTKECLVLMAIQRYFPSYDEATFSKWLEESYLPCLASYYIRGMTNSLQKVAETSIVQERQLQIANYVLNGYVIKSRLLSVSNVEILDYDFKAHKPIVTIRFSADHTEYIVSKGGTVIAGGPDDIKKSDFLVLLTINETGSKPVWKANEVHIGQVSDRI
ncbi:hypothetical protein TRFO_19496 [Tritrichomonas foetus]|uniref:Tim44-like domain-containing protein n=1 Tax=Tritrichomonas foetus TaxID=1144522 RepID=A0A1J4KIU1_9EUKA|nr:hypothetical protein TRFO_19496 [Tritrichomonas foetus]|eukprot:OHT11002.1 hypothetical protein TRFO_19496 [Tritrichomonas foetus]